MRKEECYFCGSECNNQHDEGIKSDYNDCDYCGLYTLQLDSLDAKLLKDRHLIAGYLNETKNEPFRKDIMKITEEKLKEILDDELIPKTTMRKLDKLLAYCYKINNKFDKEFTIDSAHVKRPYLAKRIYVNGDSKRTGIAYTDSQAELNSVLEAINKKGWIDVTSISNNKIAGFSISYDGREYIEMLINPQTGRIDYDRYAKLIQDKEVKEENGEKTKKNSNRNIDKGILEKMGSKAAAGLNIIAIVLLLFCILYVVLSACGVNLPTELYEVFRNLMRLK